MAAYIKPVNSASLTRGEWLEWRRGGIGGSDIGAIAGLNPFRGAFDVYIDKTIGRPDDSSANGAIYWGTVLEPVVAKEFEKQTGKQVRRCNYILQSRKSAFAFADVDRMVVGENAGLECKTTCAFNYREWENGEVPASYIAQCQWYMYVTGCERWYIACLIGGQNFVRHTIERDDELISMLVGIGREFWKNNVLAGVPPEPDASRTCCDYIKNRFAADSGGSVLLTGELAKAAEEIVEIKKQEKLLKERRTCLENKVKLYMGGAARGECARLETTWKTQRGAPRLDVEALVRDYGIDNIRDYYTETKIRKFDIKET